ncbi:MAG: hypothetical protein J5529_12470 [Prevotella sp.]|nr:hypothetical protein [Prevotella sp.]
MFIFFESPKLQQPAHVPNWLRVYTVAKPRYIGVPTFHRFRPPFPGEFPDGSLPAFTWDGSDPCPHHYGTSFAYSIVICPYAIQLSLPQAYRLR